MHQARVRLSPSLRLIGIHFAQGETNDEDGHFDRGFQGYRSKEALDFTPHPGVRTIVVVDAGGHRPGPVETACLLAYVSPKTFPDLEMVVWMPDEEDAPVWKPCGILCLRYRNGNDANSNSCSSSWAKRALELATTTSIRVVIL